MSSTITYTCDHCGKQCNGNGYASLWDEGDETRPYKHTRLDGCSKEHLWACIAKAFGVPVDGSTMGLLAAKDESIEDLKRHAATLTALANQYKAERDSLEETCRMHSARVIELEKRIEEQKAGCATLHAECERLEKEVVYQRKLYEEAIDNKPAARREVESDHYYNAAFDGVDYGKVAYERLRGLPATPKDAASWDRLKGPERNEWRAIVEPVVERVRAEKSRPSIVADNETIERFAVIVGENGGESLSSAEMERIAKAVIASITDTTKPIKPARAVEEPEARLEVKQTKWVCVEEGRAEAMREAWQKAISNGDNARVIFADGAQES